MRAIVQQSAASDWLAGRRACSSPQRVRRPPTVENIPIPHTPTPYLTHHEPTPAPQPAGSFVMDCEY